MRQVPGASKGFILSHEEARAPRVLPQADPQPLVSQKPSDQSQCKNTSVFDDDPFNSFNKNHTQIQVFALVLNWFFHTSEC